jgi:hypothetical protein
MAELPQILRGRELEDFVAAFRQASVAQRDVQRYYGKRWPDLVNVTGCTYWVDAANVSITDAYACRVRA